MPVIPNQAGKPAILLRQAWREGKRIRKKTIANLSKLPPHVVEGFRTVLKGGVAVRDPSTLFRIERSLDHGNVPPFSAPHAASASSASSREPHGSLALARRRTTPLDHEQQPGHPPRSGGNEMLDVLDWLLGRQRWIVANRHLKGATLILYDVPRAGSNAVRWPPSHNRDGKKGKMQIVFGLLCASDGCPVAVEVFPGNGDPTTGPADPATRPAG